MSDQGTPLIELRDGRLCLTYGVRKAPFEIQAKFSDDQGKTWSDAFVLKTGGGGRDMGYVRSVQRPDGRVVSAYYWHPKQTPFRQVVVTIWNVGT